MPYKLYAVEAGARHIALPLFLIASFAARLARFALTIFITAAARAWVARPHWNLPGWALAWTLVYAIYFSLRAAA